MNTGPTAAQPQRHRLAAAGLRKRVTGDQLMARRIVVGIDGSESSKAALAWALRQAKLTGAVVEAVIVWKLPATFGLIPLPHLGSLGANRKILDESIAETGNPAEMRSRIIVGHPAKVLVEASAGAELLVLGSRGHGGLMGTLLGSVSVYCVRHAHCPVMVMRSPSRQEISDPLAMHRHDAHPLRQLRNTTASGGLIVRPATPASPALRIIGPTQPEPDSTP